MNLPFAFRLSSPFRRPGNVKLFVRFRALCLRYSQRTTHLDANKRFWRHFQNVDNQPFEFYWHILEVGNGPERAQTGLQKGHSCNATVALSAFKYGSFASSKDPNEKINGLPQRFKTGFPLWLKKFRECDFVNIIHHHPTTCRDCFLECANNALIYFPIKCQQSLRHAGRHQASTWRRI